MNIYKQTTADTCLPSCMMMILAEKGIAKANQNLELEILLEGDKLSKENRTFGHLAYVCKKFNLKATYFSSKVVSEKLADELIGKIGLESIATEHREINSKLVRELLSGEEVIISIDDYALRKELHFPHFVVIDGYKGKKFRLLDPWEGKDFVMVDK